MKPTKVAIARAARSWWRACAVAACALCWLAGPVAAEPTLPSVLPSVLTSVTGSCEIEFSGTSTFHGFSGEVRSRPFALEPHLDASSGRARWNGSIEVAVAEMDTGIDRRDRKMREMFEAERFPRIVAELVDVQASTVAAARESGEFEIPFELTIREAKLPVTAKGSHWIEQGSGASFDIAFDLSLRAYGLEVPPVLGVLRVGDVVTVHAHVTLDALPDPLREPVAPDSSPGSPAPHS